MVVAVNTGVVKLLPVANAVPPAAFANQLIVAPGSAFVAVIVVTLPVHIAVPVVPAVGAAGGIDIVIVTAVRLAETQPPLLVASA